MAVCGGECRDGDQSSRIRATRRRSEGLRLNGLIWPARLRIRLFPRHKHCYCTLDIEISSLFRPHHHLAECDLPPRKGLPVPQLIVCLWLRRPSRNMLANECQGPCAFGYMVRLEEDNLNPFPSRIRGCGRALRRSSLSEQNVAVRGRPHRILTPMYQRCSDR